MMTKAACGFTAILVHSPSAIRHAFYETFLHLHIVLVAVSMAFLWIHLNGMISQTYLMAALIFWALEVSFIFQVYENPS